MAAKQDRCNDPRAQRGQKKSLSAAIFDLARNGQTSDPRLVKAIIAKKINMFLGSAIGPWDLDDEKYDEWKDVICALVDELPDYQELAATQSKKQDDWRSKHYRKW